MEEKNYFAKNIRYLRKKHDWTLRELSDTLGYADHSAVQKWESGLVNPTVDKLRALEELFHVDADAILNTDLRQRDIDYDKLMASARRMFPEARSEALHVATSQSALHTDLFADSEPVQRSESALNKPVAQGDPEAPIDSPANRLGTLIGQAIKDPSAVKAIQIFMQLSPEDRQLALGMLEGLTGNHRQ